MKHQNLLNEITTKPLTVVINYTLHLKETIYATPRGLIWTPSEDKDVTINHDEFENLIDYAVTHNATITLAD